MKHHLLLLIGLALSLAATAQTDNPLTTDHWTLDTTIFTVVDQDPQFDGGMEGLFQYISSSVIYPAQAKAQKIQGRVLVQFVIEKDGSVTNVTAVGDPDPMLKEEAIRVVQAMPKWKPGRQQGKKVRVQYMLPINFQLNK